MNPSFKVAIVGVALVFLVQSSSARLREYEEACNVYKTSENCRPDLDLVCEDGECACKELAFYDEERKACVALIGESCTPQPEYGRYYYYGYMPQITRCPKDAVCEERDPNKTPNLPEVFKRRGWELTNTSPGTYRCLCKQGYYPNEELQACLPAIEHNQPCSEELEKEGKTCDTFAGLICGESKTCVCNSTENTSYDEKTKRCVTKAGDPCHSQTFCEKNSVCSTILDSWKARYTFYFTRYSPDQKRTEMPTYKKKSKTDTKYDAKQKTGTCKCLPGFTENSEGNCVGSFSVACSAENPCNKDRYLDCIDGICQCQAGSHQAFSTADNSSCVVLPSSTCSDEAGSPRCVENSECKEGKCRCKEGFAESPSGKCMLSYENECIINNLDQDQYQYNHFYMRITQNSGLNESCNYYQGLSCNGAKCECFDSQLRWDSEVRMCVAGEGDKCGSVSMMRTSEFDYQNEPFYPIAHLYRKTFPGDYSFYNSYFVACAEGLTCTKAHEGVDGWRVCEKKANI